MRAVSDDPTHGWAFLVARGRYKGYQSLLVPDFLAESNEYGVLSQATGGDSPPDGTPAVARVHGLAAGDVVLTYRTHRLTQADLGSSSGDPLTDEFGRPLDLLYGFVVRAAGISELDDTDFGTAQAEALRTYQRFLADESAFELETSNPFVLRSVPSPEPMPSPAPASFAEPAPWPASVSAPVASPVPLAEPVYASTARPAIARRNVVLVGLLIVALSAAAWMALLRDRGPVTDVQISEPGSGVVDCASPLTIKATIRTSSKATVVYHWESTITTDSAPITVDFSAPAEQLVETTVQLPGPSGTPVKFTQTLVIDDPNSKNDSQDFTLTCR